MSDLAIVLAAGKGTRMGSPLPKVLHRAAGQSLLAHALAAANAAGLTRPAVVIGPDTPEIGIEALARAPLASLHVQAERLGSGHAVLAARAAIESQRPQRIVVLFGDSPLVRPATIRRLLDALATGVAVAVAGFAPSAGGAYGRLVMEGERLLAIREAKDASPAELQSRLVNGGLMAIAGAHALPLLERIDRRNAQGEYYLTDIVELANVAGASVVVIEVDEAEVLGVNTPAELAQVDRLLRERSAQPLVLASTT